MRVALKFAYDGRLFHGYARQPNVETVEARIIHSLKQTGYITPHPKESIFRSASRTDKGVSALGNVIAFNTEKNVDYLIDEINDSLHHIVFYGKKRVEDSFYPRHASQRIYHYYVNKDDIDIEILQLIVPLFIGSFNFSNFARVESYKNPVRSIDNINIIDFESFFILEFCAQTYLWHQIRRIVSAILKVKKQKNTKQEIMYALTHPEKQYDFGVASPEQLILNDIIYPFSFQIDENGLRKKEELKEKIISDF